MRRSKEDALRTRQNIILAARRVFVQRGVSQTTLEQIAAAAGVTRGAIYGHFRDKSALFQCMREQVRLPLVDAMADTLAESSEDPLAGVQHYLLAVIAALRDDPATSATFHILNFKCEYAGDMAGDIDSQVERSTDFVDKLEHAYRMAAEKGQLREDAKPRLNALQTCAFMMGLIRLWLLDTNGHLVRTDAEELVRSHIAGLR